MTANASDYEKVRDALIVLFGHLPLFSDDKRKAERAQKRLRLRDEAFNALDRMADHAQVQRVERRTSA